MATVEAASAGLARAAAARSATLAALVLELRKDPEVYLFSIEWGVGGIFLGGAARGARCRRARRVLGRARGRRGRPRRDPEQTGALRDAKKVARDHFTVELAT